MHTLTVSSLSYPVASYLAIATNVNVHHVTSLDLTSRSDPAQGIIFLEAVKLFAEDAFGGFLMLDQCDTSRSPPELFAEASTLGPHLPRQFKNSANPHAGLRGVLPSGCCELCFRPRKGHHAAGLPSIMREGSQGGNGVWGFTVWDFKKDHKLQAV